MTCFSIKPPERSANRLAKLPGESLRDRIAAPPPTSSEDIKKCETRKSTNFTLQYYRTKYAVVKKKTAETAIYWIL